MKPCPSCGVTGRVTVRSVLTAKEPGSYSIAGFQDKTSARESAVLECSACGLTVHGRLEGVTVGDDAVITGGHFVADAPPEAGRGVCTSQ